MNKRWFIICIRQPITRNKSEFSENECSIMNFNWNFKLDGQGTLNLLTTVETHHLIILQEQSKRMKILIEQFNWYDFERQCYVNHSFFKVFWYSANCFRSLKILIVAWFNQLSRPAPSFQTESKFNGLVSRKNEYGRPSFRNVS